MEQCASEMFSGFYELKVPFNILYSAGKAALQSVRLATPANVVMGTWETLGSISTVLK